MFDVRVRKTLQGCTVERLFPVARCVVVGKRNSIQIRIQKSRPIAVALVKFQQRLVKLSRFKQKRLSFCAAEILFEKVIRISEHAAVAGKCGSALSANDLFVQGIEPNRRIGNDVVECRSMLVRNITGRQNFFVRGNREFFVGQPGQQVPFEIDRQSPSTSGVDPKSQNPPRRPRSFVIAD